MGEPVAEGLELVEVANAPEVWQQETNLTKYMSESKFAPVQSPVPANEKHIWKVTKAERSCSWACASQHSGY
ncbi:hypothetical protein PRZ48_014402 [Zasmidium cellare]|uniref:Uncharacterized protein n=1 Tax=Zasmidium cellare TaxID=395010 RepID=A0ABR0DY71_ZASCE|nr:hypothetical protein PRZ48_014402 [Zasmidium cellare]